MSDIALVLKDFCFDINILNSDLETDEGFETAVAISLFTDKRVTEEELPDLQVSKRGWWGDMYSDRDGDQIGSKLWTLEREKRTPQVLLKFEDFASEALEWFIEDGISNEINVDAFYIEGQTILEIEIVRPTGSENRYKVFWEAQEIKRI